MQERKKERNAKDRKVKSIKSEEMIELEEKVEFFRFEIVSSSLSLSFFFRLFLSLVSKLEHSNCFQKM